LLVGISEEVVWSTSSHYCR